MPLHLLPWDHLSWLSGPCRSGLALRPFRQGNLGDPTVQRSASLPRPPGKALPSPLTLSQSLCPRRSHSWNPPAQPQDS